MYDISKAQPVEHNGVVIGYILPVNELYWLPLTIDGNPSGPPSYEADARFTVRRSAGIEK